MPQAGTPYVVVDPNIHEDTEGDDLWTYLQMWKRTGQQGYKERAEAWARYFLEDYVQCRGGARKTYCYDHGFGPDHTFGWGLVAWWRETSDARYLDAAVAILRDVATLYAAPRYTPGQYPMSYYGPRMGARHLLLALEVAKATGDAPSLALREKLIALFDQSPDWDPHYGMYFLSQGTTDAYAGAGAYAAGLRAVSSFQVGILAEAFGRVVEETGHPGLKAKLIAMARFVTQYAVDPVTGYVGYVYGVNSTTGKAYNVDALSTPPTFNPAYTTSQVGLLARAAQWTGEAALQAEAARLFWCGNTGAYGTTVPCSTGRSLHHFVDTVFDTSQSNFYLAANKGEYFYVYPLFRP